MPDRRRESLATAKPPVGRPEKTPQAFEIAQNGDGDCAYGEGKEARRSRQAEPPCDPKSGQKMAPNPLKNL